MRIEVRGPWRREEREEIPSDELERVGRENMVELWVTAASLSLLELFHVYIGLEIELRSMIPNLGYY